VKKKILYTIYSAVFVGICLAPAVLTPFVKSDASKENRTLSSVPSIKTEDGGLNFDFFSEFETYFSEHFAFRQELVTVDGEIRSNILGTSSDEDVIVGKDGWLYYTPTENDFMNINTLSDRGINNIIHNLTLLSDYCKEQNAEFIFTVAPNKNTIYPEYMPYNYIETDNPDNYEKLTAAYSESADSFAFADLKETLLEAKALSDVPIYHKTDTHWNNVGALAARNFLISFVSDEDNLFGSTEWTKEKDWSGDLAEMLYPSDVPLDTQYYSNYSFAYNYIGAFHSFDDITIKTSCESGEGNLLMYRDSFGAAILPFMAESFGTAEFSRAVPYNTASVSDGTTVILEIVERNLGNLQKYAPVMPAPVYEGSTAEGLSAENAVIKVEESGMYFHIFGELEDEFFKGDSSEILVTVGGVTYEAFNCFEDKLLGREGETSDNGFSLYIPKNDGDEIPDVSDIGVTVIS
jgi:hypothetical protein